MRRSVCERYKPRPHKLEAYKTKDGTELAITAATWEVYSKVTFESLASEFARKPAQAWRNYGSKVTGTLEELAIKDPDLVLRNLNTLRSDPWDYRLDRLSPHIRGQKGLRYFMHFDLAKNKDRAGMSLVHRERSGIIYVDFMHAVAAKVGQNIDFSGLRDLVYLFHSLGFAIEMVTYDQWQSEDSRQLLEAKGFKTDHCSADKTTAPYDTLIEMMLTGRVDYYNHPLFLREMKQLRTNGLKYDHPKKGSKDVADAVACATWTCINYELENPKEPPGKVKVIRQSGKRNPYLQKYGERTSW